MSVKRRSNGIWTVADTRKRYSGGQWTDIGRGYLIQESGNHKLWDSVTVYSNTYSATGTHMYEGGRETWQGVGSNYVVQGGTQDNYTTLLFFNFSQVSGVLENAITKSVSLYVKRDGIGSENVNARIHYGVQKPNTTTQKYSDFNYYPATDIQWETIRRSEGKWFTLKSEVHSMLRNGTIGCFAMMADGDKLMENYMRMDPSQFKLKIEYTL